jgi:protein-disulfide isomerase
MRALFLSALVVLGLLASATPASAGFDPDAIYDVPDGGAPTAGEPDAPITIVEFSDYACGYCIRARGTMASLELLYPGQIRWIHRSVPFISGTSLGAEAAHAAAAQGQLEPMEAQLYALGGAYDRIAVEMIAQSIGLDMVRFRAELDAVTHRAAIAADVELARRLGVTSTPTFFVNGRAVLGSVPLSSFVAVVEAELVRAAQLQEREPALRGAALYQRLVAGGLPSADDGPRVRTPAVELATSIPYRVGLGLPGLTRGPATAPATLVVFSDFECHFCAKNEPALTHIRKVYGPSLRIVFRHLPLPFHKNAQLAAEASMAAAAQGKFWELHDRLFLSTAALTRADLEREAEAAGLLISRFRADLDSRRWRDAVRLDAAGGMALGIDGTPTMFLNGMMISGAKAPAQLEAAVKIILELTQPMRTAGVADADVYAVTMTNATGHERSDPTTVPLPRAAQLLQPSPRERLQAVTAACRRGAAPAATLGALPEPMAAIATKVCATYGVAL